MGKAALTRTERDLNLAELNCRSPEAVVVPQLKPHIYCVIIGSERATPVLERIQFVDPTILKLRVLPCVAEHGGLDAGCDVWPA